MRYLRLLNRFVFIFFITLLLEGCATTYITSVVKNENDHPYSSMMVVFTNGTSFKGLSETNYNQFVKDNFNDVSNLKFRNHIEKSLARNIATNGLPRIVKSSDLFDVDESYTYHEFMDKINSTACQSILLVNLDNYWTTSNYRTTHYDHNSVTREHKEPNSSYDVYLYDINDLQRYKWIGEVTVKGDFAGYDTLNNHFSRRVASKLRKAKFIN